MIFIVDTEATYFQIMWRMIPSAWKFLSIVSHQLGMSAPYQSCPWLCPEGRKALGRLCYKTSCRNNSQLYLKVTLLWYLVWRWSPYVSRFDSTISSFGLETGPLAIFPLHQFNLRKRLYWSPINQRCGRGTFQTNETFPIVFFKIYLCAFQE